MPNLDSLLVDAKNLITFFRDREAENINRNLTLGWTIDTSVYNRCVTFLQALDKIKNEDTKTRDGEGRIHILQYLCQQVLIEKTIKLSESGEEGFVYDAKIRDGAVYVKLEDASSEWHEVDPYTFCVYAD